jgi:Acetyltransferase (GNAT) domain
MSAEFSFATELQLPVASRTLWGVGSESVGWLQELREMRGRVLYDGGRRTKFLRADGSYCDDDPLDSVSYHVILRSCARIVGCARVTPLVDGVCGVVESTLGTKRFHDLIAQIGEDRNFISEASRWMVTPELRGRGLGFHLVAASWAVGRWLGTRTGFVAAGTHDDQDRMLIKMGAQSVDVPIISSHEFDDDLRVLHFDVQHPSESMVRWVDHITTALGLACLLDETFARRDT